MTAVTEGTLGAPQLNAYFPLDNVEAMRPGFLVSAQDPYWGNREFVYARYNGTIRQFGLCVAIPALVAGRFRYEMTEVPNTANLGRPLHVAMRDGVAGNFGWFCVTGLTPVNCTASVAADTAIGIAAAGQGGANAAGKQLLNARSIVAATATVAKVCQGNAGSLELQIPGPEGWFAGVYLSGTGIAAATTVTQIDASGTRATLSAALTAQINGGTVTGTYNNAVVFYNVAHLNRVSAQGAIT